MGSNVLKKAQLEFQILKNTVNQPIIAPFEKEILALVDKFGKSGQSGCSTHYTAIAISQAVKDLCLQNVICPITDAGGEWTRHEQGFYQNNRLTSVFKKNKNGRPYYLNAIVFKGAEEWDSFRGSVYIDENDFELIRSSQFINLPFKPKTFYLDVLRIDISKDKAEEMSLNYVEGDDGCYYYVLKDKNQLKEVFEYYVKSNKKTKNE